MTKMHEKSMEGDIKQRLELEEDVENLLEA
jgi:hypothetical protein